MTQPDFEQAKRYALARLENELSPNLFYHSIRHTRDEVLPAAERLALLEGVAADDRGLLFTAALYHDLGFIEQYAVNEVIGVRIAAEALPRFGYTPEQIQVISGIILATKLPQMPRTRLEEIMADADLDTLGREEFVVRNQDLRQELAAYGRPVTDAMWYAAQLKFLHANRYFTAAAKQLRNAQKQRNIEWLADQLTQCLAPTRPVPRR
jgi:uncharacterized protein